MNVSFDTPCILSVSLSTEKRSYVNLNTTTFKMPLNVYTYQFYLQVFPCWQLQELRPTIVQLLQQGCLGNGCYKTCYRHHKDDAAE